MCSFQIILLFSEASEEAEGDQMETSHSNDASEPVTVIE